MRSWMAVAVCAAALWASVGTPAFAAPARFAGAVKVVKASGSSSGRSSGGSATVFSLRPPNGATCAKDSADGNYRVQSFLVPAGTDLKTIRYKSQGPDVPGGWALYQTSTDAYIQEMTANATTKGGPGPIIDPPDMTFAVFTGGELSPGAYEMGLACSLFNETVKYWSTSVVLTKDDSDVPAHLHWQLADAAPKHSSPRRGTVVAGVLAAVVVVGGVGWRRRSTR